MSAATLTCRLRDASARRGQRLGKEDGKEHRGAGPLRVEHLKSLTEYPPRQGADSVSARKAIENAMKKLEPMKDKGEEDA